MVIKPLINLKNLRSAVAFFFLFFLHGTSIGNGQQGISYNGLGIGEEWEFGKQMLISVPKFNGGKMLKCSSSAHFLPIPCYAFALFLALIFSKLETILKRNKKYFEKSLQKSK